MIASSTQVYSAREWTYVMDVEARINDIDINTFSSGTMVPIAREVFPILSLSLRYLFEVVFCIGLRDRIRGRFGGTLSLFGWRPGERRIFLQLWRGDVAHLSLSAFHAGQFISVQMAYPFESVHELFELVA